MQKIIELGLLPLYPKFNRHEEILVGENRMVSDSILKIREFINASSKDRVKNASLLINEYHTKMENSVRTYEKDIT